MNLVTQAIRRNNDARLKGDASGRERLSLVLAYDPNFETFVDPNAFCADGETPRHEPIACGNYLLWRFGKAFSYRQRRRWIPSASSLREWPQESARTVPKAWCPA